VKACGTPFTEITWKSVWWMWKTCSSFEELSSVQRSVLPSVTVVSMRLWS